MTTQTKPFYVKQLEKTFETRVKINARYSLRAFARDLGISAPRLSGVLNQKFGLSQVAAKEICTTLRFDPKVTDDFITSVIAHHDRSPRARQVAQMKIAGRKRVFDHLEMDRFNVVSEWYHFALMELTRIEQVRPEDAAQIAQRLGIARIEAVNAVDRLLGVGLLKLEGGFLKRTGSYLVGNQTMSGAIQNLNQQLLQKARESIQSQTLAERDIRTLTLAIAEESIPEFNQLFNDFQSKVRNLAEKRPVKDQVYAWTMQFYRLTERKQK